MKKTKLLILPLALLSLVACGKGGTSTPNNSDDTSAPDVSGSSWTDVLNLAKTTFEMNTVSVPAPAGQIAEFDVYYDYYYGSSDSVYVELSGTTSSAYHTVLNSNGWTSEYDSTYDIYEATKSGTDLRLEFYDEEGSTYIFIYEDPELMISTNWSEISSLVKSKLSTNITLSNPGASEYYYYMAHWYGDANVVVDFEGSLSTYFATLQNSGWVLDMVDDASDYGVDVFGYATSSDGSIEIEASELEGEVMMFIYHASAY